MNKMISAVVAAAALAAGGLTWAQDGGAECQASGRCGYQGNAVPRPDGSLNNPALIVGNEQIREQQRRDGAIYGYGWPYSGLSQYEYRPYARTQRDRDGDGIRNSRDRYPDDPRYR